MIGRFRFLMFVTNVIEETISYVKIVSFSVLLSLPTPKGDRRGGMYVFTKSYFCR